ncbi:protein ECERIFERUM 2-like [Salvia miltiorrhiza]|uniref:protein ECERIFERUM 2-like n=1 Tax=Salvia miltiorrhiza TaxID=226208 RepID=UPI0025AC7290|nr:protein ECERIFERUM 2-like [Salvia miltiorrhiza]
MVWAELDDIKLSTVVPASITGEDKNHQLSDLDLAFKLHYITSVHFFGADAAAELTIHDLKKPMFPCLQLYYPICGRLRRHDAPAPARPYVKCNDSGVRVVEATCAKTVAEWLAAVHGGDHHRLLVYDQPILAHDFGFTPLVFLQLTKFQCGGLCVGLRWAHILGDAFSASEFLNMWGKFMANETTPRQLLTAPANPPHPSPPSSLSAVKLLDPIGDDWLAPNSSKMQTHSFHITQTQLSDLLAKYKAEPFQIISAILWKSMAKIRGTNIITVCRNTKNHDKNDHEMPSNARHLIGVVEAETSSVIAEADILEISKLIADKFFDQTGMIQKQMEEGKGLLDFVVYGANLTFLDLEGVDLYGLQLKGRRPLLGSISIRGVGDEGAVVVAADASGGGRLVNVILPEDHIHHLKNDLRLDWDIV